MHREDILATNIWGNAMAEGRTNISWQSILGEIPTKAKV